MAIYFWVPAPMILSRSIVGAYCGLGPEEWLWIAVVLLEKAVDRGLKVDDRAEDAASQALSGQD
jgi:hypothetical protein